MSFFCSIYVCIIYFSNLYKTNKPSLRAYKPVLFNHKKPICICEHLKKRASSFISYKSVKASMTLEAALVLPVFLFAVLSLISTINIMKIKSCMDVAVAEAGNEIAIENYGGYVGDLAMPLYVRQKINAFLDKNLSPKDAENISKYIFVTDISLFEEENIVAFRVDYRVTPNFGILGLSSVKLHTTYYGHSWLGYEKKEEKETMVYISKEANVYHLNKNCTHLNVTIKEIPYANLDNYRNNSREKYKICSFCDNLTNNGTVYITPEGSNYHKIETCIGLTRSIYTVPLSTVLHKNVCTRCGK